MGLTGYGLGTGVRADARADPWGGDGVRYHRLASVCPVLNDTMRRCLASWLRRRCAESARCRAAALHLHNAKVL